MGSRNCACVPGPAVAAVARFARPGDGADDAGGGVYPADDVIQPVYHVHVAVGVNLQRIGLVERRRSRRAAVAGIALGPGAGDGGDNAGSGVHAADAMVHRLGDIQVPATSKAHMNGSLSSAAGAGPAVAGVAPSAGSRQRWR